ncbi:MAG: glycosyl transferase group 1 [uncultured bacterium]|nr:MAG: glycosyl transferase group 1 [uncultured bacterium]OGJ47061.1 MAG: hypothetical protein A2244_04975 [Candidatus Peregrinibacteria bacterium RIFOXYA2_FULL_41_18]OGJ49749.1 MAG: hypothetical protein A2344_03635 [Candidatus Peregrinibacteria bacterium RIFOXYB12_FULL_41_12]OGJ52638.1 MAG: hypothetical protein A2448_00215 [Candidatus Peregrinibacteria bacterium RIFOXYC2_FULL_41_22]OGJ54100.1 MAG: hypothetical protein A2336_03790 [Candidatus Peregrinibacteria bacterium RIFOXYB2_FULL_41_88]
MRILIVTPIFPPVIGGPATYTWELAHKLVNDEVSIIAFGDILKPIDCAKLYQIKVRAGLLKKIPFIGSFLRQFELFFAVMKYGRKADLIYLQGPLVVGFFGGLAAKFISKPTVMKFVGDIAWETAHRRGKTEKNLDEFLACGDGGISRRLQRSAFRRADAVVVPSNYLKEVLVRHYLIPEKKIFVVYNAIDIPFIHKKGHDGTKTIVTVGRLVPHKNIAGIIEALGIVGRLQMADYRLKIVGEGPEGTRLRQLAHDLGITEKVRFLGALSHEDTLKEIAHADLFILNSNYEGLPHVIVEAMYLRTPVIATNISGTNEIATVRTAILTKPNNPSDLARNINAAESIDNTEEAYRFVSENFNQEKSLRKLRDLFLNLCQK